MKANPDKFQAIAIGPKTNRHNLSIHLKGNEITCEEDLKLLGVIVDSLVNFAIHSEWDTLIKGVPQLSILGPVLFNVFYK